MKSGMELLLRALDFAARAHSGQERKGSRREPYINHPISVALLLVEATGGEDAELIAAAFLHDTLEDTDTSRQELANRFGMRVARIVMEVSDEKGLRRQVRKRRQVQRAGCCSQEAKLLILGDKICNLRSVLCSPPEGWNQRRKWEYFQWAARVVEQIRGTDPGLECLFDQIYAAGAAELATSRKTGRETASQDQVSDSGEPGGGQSRPR